MDALPEKANASTRTPCGCDKCRALCTSAIGAGWTALRLEAWSSARADGGILSSWNGHAERARELSGLLALGRKKKTKQGWTPSSRSIPTYRHAPTCMLLANAAAVTLRSLGPAPLCTPASTSRRRPANHRDCQQPARTPRRRAQRRPRGRGAIPGRQAGDRRKHTPTEAHPRVNRRRSCPPFACLLIQASASLRRRLEFLT